jgi:uridylate kinase
LGSKNKKTDAIYNAEEKYEKARAFDKLRIEQITSEHVHFMDTDKTLRPLIDEIRLGLCLNYAVFLYEVKNHKKAALRILK